jgi:O-antigen ligase
VRWFKRRPGFLKVLIPVCFCLYVILAFGFNVNGELAGAVGRDPTLTERTKIWATLLGMHTNPLLGTGYQSFWLGSRLEWFWHNSGLGTLNEAHNGYLEVYLDLGLIGVGFLAAFLVAAYRNISRSFTTSSSIAVLTFAVWTALVFYNMTEAAFEGGMLWMLVLMGALAMPARAKKRVPNLAGLETSTSDGLAPVYLEPSTAPR